MKYHRYNNFVLARSSVILSAESMVWCRSSAFPEMHHVLAVGGEICLEGSILFASF